MNTAEINAANVNNVVFVSQARNYVTGHFKTSQLGSNQNQPL